jgi:hypothetical protein
MYMMKKKVVEIYANYNSVIEDGKRVRRMRRTELSAQKIMSGSLRRGSSSHHIKFIQNQGNCRKVLTRSTPKIEVKYNENEK